MLERTWSASSACSHASERTSYSSYAASSISVGCFEVKSKKTTDPDANDSSLDVSNATILLGKLEARLKKKIDHIDTAKVIMKNMREIRSLMIKDEEVSMSLFKKDIITTLLSSSKKIFSFPILVDETLRFLLPFISVNFIRDDFLNDFINKGGIIFCLTAIKNFGSENGICLRSVYIISFCLDLIDIDNNFLHDSKTYPKEDDEDIGSCYSSLSSNKIRSSSTYKKKPQDIIHQFILHSAISTLPKLLLRFAELNKEIGIKSIIKGDFFKIMIYRCLFLCTLNSFIECISHL